MCRKFSNNTLKCSCSVDGLRVRLTVSVFHKCGFSVNAIAARILPYFILYHLYDVYGLEAAC